MSIEKTIGRYGLIPDKYTTVDLRICFWQNTPNKPVCSLFNHDRQMIYSPHVKIAQIYYRHGEEELRKRYKDTEYCKMKEYFGKGNKFPPRLVSLFDSLKNGYLKGKYKEDYIVLLMQSFAISRYNRDEEDLVPEVFSGHHRIGALLALERYDAKVLIAKDAHPGDKFSEGKIHNLCREI